MRVLLNECVNPRVKDAFPEHEVRTVKEMGWRGVTNGKLMILAQLSFDVFVTVDQNLEYQQDVSRITLGIVVVAVPDNNIKYFKPIFVELLEAAESVCAGQVIHVVSPELQAE